MCALPADKSQNVRFANINTKVYYNFIYFNNVQIPGVRADYLVEPELKWAICVPNGCTAKDIENHLNKFFLAHIFEVKEDQCYSINTEPKLDSGDYTVL